jgi:hypothetical protein
MRDAGACPASRQRAVAPRGIGIARAPAERVTSSARRSNVTLVSPTPKNPRRLSDLGALRVVDPEKWARTVNKAVKTAEGSLDEAAQALDVSRRTLQRWLADDDRLEASRALVSARVGRPAKAED